MRIIQSFWSLPVKESRQQTINNRLAGGWLRPEFHLLSWAYSCLRLRSVYDSVELITDNAGKALLIDALQLPYTGMDIELENIYRHHPDLWALGKVYAIKKQTQPFIHVDGDVFIWKRFPERIEYAPLVAQNKECNFSFYRLVFQQLLELECYIPAVITDHYKQGNGITAYNAGIIGGHDLSFIGRYTTEIIRFVELNNKHLEELPAGQLNAFFEQYLYYCLAEKEQVRVECYTDITDKSLINKKFKGLYEFTGAPSGECYIHLFGEDAKKNEAICTELDARMKREYPYYYDLVMQTAESLCHV